MFSAIDKLPAQCSPNSLCGTGFQPVGPGAMPRQSRVHLDAPILRSGGRVPPRRVPLRRVPLRRVPLRRVPLRRVPCQRPPQAGAGMFSNAGPTRPCSLNSCRVHLDAPTLRSRTVMTVLTGAILFALPLGCATPQGVLFPPIDPPRVWPAPPDTPRIQLVGVLGGSDDLKAQVSGAEILKSAFRGPRPPINFTAPHGVAVRSDDLVAVADASGAAVHILDLESRTHRLVTGFEDDRFAMPIGVAWANGHLFVTDAQRHEVIQLDEKGHLQRRFGCDTLTRPVGIAFVARTNQLWVVDGGAHRLVAFNLATTKAATIGERGTALGQFNFPTHIAAEGDRILVADAGNFRVQILSASGEGLASIGQKGNGAGDLSLPKGVAFDRFGRIYIVDAHFENVQIFDPDGRLLMAFGHEGSGAGEFALPAGLTIDDHDRIWVADSGNRRLQLFAHVPLELTGWPGSEGPEGVTLCGTGFQPVNSTPRRVHLDAPKLSMGTGGPSLVGSAVRTVCTGLVGSAVRTICTGGPGSLNLGNSMINNWVPLTACCQCSSGARPDQRRVHFGAPKLSMGTGGPSLVGSAMRTVCTGGPSLVGSAVRTVCTGGPGSLNLGNSMINNWVPLAACCQPPSVHLDAPTSLHDGGDSS